MAAVASRYARAFADAVFDMKFDARLASQQLQTLVALLQSSMELRRVWENPSIPAEQKRALLDAIAAREGLAKPVRNFAAVLIDHHRIAQLPEIARQVETELDRRLGLAEAEITTARDLSADEKLTLERQVAQVAGRQVRAHYVTDPKLLGGAVVRLGSTIYDGSVKGQLQRIKEQLSAE